MESDAKGQLGGLESSGRDRERLANQSAGWKCGVCGKSNEEIMRECAEAARVKEEEDAAKGNSPKKDEVEIPKELKLGYKDELGGNQNGKEKEDTTTEDEDAAELAEGFVQTAPTAPYPPARPAQSVPQPTATIPQSQRPPPPQVTEAARVVHAYQQQQAVQRRSNDGVPVWIDRSIAGVVVCLVFMVLKMLLGL
jgi:ubiquitin-conjugating enzyme E2 J1